MWTDRVLCLHCVWPCSSRVTRPQEDGAASTPGGFSVVGEGLYITMDLHGEAASVGGSQGAQGHLSRCHIATQSYPWKATAQRSPIDTASAQTPVTPAILSSMSPAPWPQEFFGIKAS